MRLIRFLVRGFGLCVWGVCGPVGAALAADTAFLDPAQAFQLQAGRPDPRTLSLRWTIAPGYKLYRHALAVTQAADGPPLAAPDWPAGETRHDPLLDRAVELYHGELAVRVPVPASSAPQVLSVQYQGCADEGFCYPPQTRYVRLVPGQSGALPLSASPSDPAPPGDAAPALPAVAAAPGAMDDGFQAEQTLREGRPLQVIGLFWVFGLLLSFTPCVLPMVPILSSIIVGQGAVSRGRGLWLSGAYSLGMATVYTSLGVAAGLLGEGLAAYLQHPAVLVGFALLMVLMALSMFDVYTLQMPAGLQARLSATSNRLPGGRALGVAGMGALSALIVGPCVAAPLASTLVYISQSQDAWLGGMALFAMAMGMSVPLWLTGLSAGSLLPRVGGWMDGIKHSCGLLLIAVALWMVQPVLPEGVSLLGWGLWALLAAVFCGLLDPAKAGGGLGGRVRQALAVGFLAIGVLELLGAASGGRDALQPLGHFRPAAVAGTGPAAEAVRFTRVHSLQELEARMAQSTQPILLDFYADWCVSCKEMERWTFSDPAVAAQMRRFQLLQVDVTAHSPQDRAVLQRFGLYGAPALVVLHQGQERTDGRVIGFVKAAAFAAHLQRQIQSISL
ncbi:MAG: protein-disulfide reductase DsbD [Burkholderiaceae bacterium]|nr:protein-disulfide reductase DsbD [Burkholderiaceae bacterium]